MPTPQAVGMATSEQFAVAGGCNVLDAKVDTQVIVHLADGRFDDIHGRNHIPVARAVDKVALALAGGEQASLAGATHERYALPTSGGPDREVVVAEAQDTVVVSNAAERPEVSLLDAVDLIGVGHFGDHAHYDLSRERETLANLGVYKFVQRELAEGALPPGPSTDKIGCPVGLAERIAEQCGLLRRGQQLERNDQPHACSVLKYRTFVR